MLNKCLSTKIKQYFLSQINEIRVGGLSLVIRKSVTILRIVLRGLLIIAAAPIVLIIVVISPVVLIRFGTMRSERIGHFAADVEAYLCARDNKPKKQHIIDIICCPEPVCNRQLQAMWKRTLRVTKRTQPWELLGQACSFWTRGKKYQINFSGRSADYKLFLTTEPHVKFTNKEELQGKELLEKLGIPSGASWICMHNRDSEYLEEKLSGHNWSYHNHRDFSAKTMLLAAEELSRRDYYVVRIGSIAKEALASADSKIIDYASSSHRSDFADIYLGAKCVAYIGSDSGIATIPILFRHPVSYINYCPTQITEIINHGIYQWPFITKHAWHKGKQRFLSQRELFELGLEGASEAHIFKNAGVELIDNTAEEIRDLAIEIDHRLKNTWVPQEGDEELQEKYWATFRKHAPLLQQSNIKSRIGSAFLRKHSYLFD